jgi:hypothetical protein
MVKPYPYGGWGPRCYQVQSLDSVLEWLRSNQVAYWVVSTGSGGHIIQLKEDDTLFRLVWL